MTSYLLFSHGLTNFFSLLTVFHVDNCDKSCGFLYDPKIFGNCWVQFDLSGIYNRHVIFLLDHLFYIIGIVYPLIKETCSPCHLWVYSTLINRRIHNIVSRGVHGLGLGLARTQLDLVGLQKMRLIINRRETTGQLSLVAVDFDRKWKKYWQTEILVDLIRDREIYTNLGKDLDW